ncbi:MAG: hypothetical protein P1U77_19880, partial [Rubripirellula sp.]|nr:hypothetical protein [Rubripirellula sp.]
TTGEIELDGRDPTMTLAGTAKSPHESLFFEYRNWNAVRSGRWKIVRARPDIPFELYDLMIDWKEGNDLSQQQPKTVSRLTGLFKQWRDQFPNSPER